MILRPMILLEAPLICLSIRYCIYGYGQEQLMGDASQNISADYDGSMTYWPAGAGTLLVKPSGGLGGTLRAPNIGWVRELHFYHE
jgi:hypothetical protein